MDFECRDEGNRCRFPDTWRNDHCCRAHVVPCPVDHRQNAMDQEVEGNHRHHRRSLDRRGEQVVDVVEVDFREDRSHASVFRNNRNWINYNDLKNILTKKVFDGVFEEYIPGRLSGRMAERLDPTCLDPCAMQNPRVLSMVAETLGPRAGSCLSDSRASQDYSPPLVSRAYWSSAFARPATGNTS